MNCELMTASPEMIATKTTEAANETDPYLEKFQRLELEAKGYDWITKGAAVAA